MWGKNSRDQVKINGTPQVLLEISGINRKLLFTYSADNSTMKITLHENIETHSEEKRPMWLMLSAVCSIYRSGIHSVKMFWTIVFVNLFGYLHGAIVTVQLVWF